MKHMLERLFARETLSFDESYELMQYFMSGRADDLVMAGALGALAGRGETAEEIAGMAQAMRDQMEGFPEVGELIIDVCGTGGERLEGNIKAFNISTTVAFIVAACGVRVAKHGNRAVSSQSGSADVLEELGLNVDLSANQSAEALEKIGVAFLFAPSYHPAMRHLKDVRSALGVPTIMNLLGPLCNPAKVKRQVIGCYDWNKAKIMADALQRLAVEEAMIVNAEDGMDEFSISSPTRVAHIKDGVVKEESITPQSVGLTEAPIDTIAGGDARTNAEMIVSILKNGGGPTQDIVCLNAAAALVVAGKADTFQAGIRMASEAIASGVALKKFEDLKAYQ